MKPYKLNISLPQKNISLTMSAGGMQTISAMIEMYAYKLVLSMSVCRNETIFMWSEGVERRMEGKKGTERYHCFFGINAPVCKGYVGNHSTNKTKPIEGQFSEWCHWHTWSIQW